MVSSLSTPEISKVTGGKVRMDFLFLEEDFGISGEKALEVALKTLEIMYFS